MSPLMRDQITLIRKCSRAGVTLERLLASVDPLVTHQVSPRYKRSPARLALERPFTRVKPFVIRQARFLSKCAVTHAAPERLFFPVGPLVSGNVASVTARERTVSTPVLVRTLVHFPLVRAWPVAATSEVAFAVPAGKPLHSVPLFWLGTIWCYCFCGCK